MISYNIGLLSEYLVLFYYMVTLHKILHHRYKTNVGEIDLIMLRGRQLIFIEVKARKHGLGENIVLCTQQQRITRAAQMFLAKTLNIINMM
jgi:putative endonuclease